MKKCSKCGVRMRRVHRTFAERFSYLAVYRCPECSAVENSPRPYGFHLGSRCRCPRCGTYRVSKLKERDHIDRMATGLLNFLERMAGGRLYHCCFCRLQFYDRRRMASVGRSSEPAPIDVAENPELIETQGRANPGA